MVIQGRKRFALLLAAQDSDYVKKVYGGYYNVFVETLGDEGDKWDTFRVVEGDFPSMDDLEKYDGFVISGSPHDAHGHEDWVLELCILLQTLFDMQKKVLGICFGHQILCRALGGKVARSCSGWDIGVRRVKFIEDFHFSIFLSTDYDQRIIPPTLSIIECHQDEVWEVPSGARVLAHSEKTGVEMFTFGENILGIQGHPEYNKDILNNLIDRLHSNNSIDIVFVENAKLQLMEAEPDTESWQRICKGFLKRDMIHIW
ncbi:gamma-glutamyl peptidase 5-like [Andrographis paniculata]|uniref:gamma-glutamyl peptidase 5-like n=1 Tax=Andrographis paniculata TaxID=175694 RepID=UPI0021E6F23E|nr:gamma-glutamyl peptidase 5-like [Andrographis paniculata]